MWISQANEKKLLGDFETKKKRTLTTNGLKSIKYISHNYEYKNKRKKY